MTEKMYKYFPGENLSLVFAKDGFCGIKCSLPKDYNDPYELFLGVDLGVSPGLLAAYRDIVQELPQYPTTCFSKSPTVTPMWAHYANNHSGFVLEFDVEEIKANFEEISVSDVQYKDSPDEKIKGFLERASGTKKPRHAIWLQDMVLFQAYFSKSTAWSYEQERRIVADLKYCEVVSGNIILFLPMICLSSIIVGKNIGLDANALSVELATKNSLNWYATVIGKSRAQPFFKDLGGSVSIFDGNKIISAENSCGSCSDPISTGLEFCPWCSITDAHKQKAANGNPLRIMDHYGLLQDYYKGIEKIRRGTR